MASGAASQVSVGALRYAIPRAILYSLWIGSLSNKLPVIVPFLMIQSHRSMSLLFSVFKSSLYRLSQTIRSDTELFSVISLTMFKQCLRPVSGKKPLLHLSIIDR